MNIENKRCGWVKLSDPVYAGYHDEEWGRPLHDDRALFELFSL
ncbi:MAG: DNA-3-methyladenine glycosylase I [Helicobacteraceae bacterium]|nr:DNA-3-methyladenine glycosylase I [Helicobacteraceae bacterium]